MDGITQLDTFTCRWFESRRIWAAGLIVSELCDAPSHWSQNETLDSWLKREGVPGISGIDTRQLTKIIREKGTMLGKIFVGPFKDPSGGGPIPQDVGHWVDPNLRNLAAEVSTEVLKASHKFILFT